MSVAKRRRTKIVVRNETYYWQVQPHHPFDCEPWLVVLSSDKKLNFHYPLSAKNHEEFVSKLQDEGYELPIPPNKIEPIPENIKKWNWGLVPAFQITPSFVRQLIEWCLDNDYQFSLYV